MMKRFPPVLHYSLAVEGLSLSAIWMLHQEETMKLCSVILVGAVLSAVPVYGQDACAQLGVDCSHSTTQQRPSSEDNERRGEELDSNGDTSSEVRRYNKNLKRIRKGGALINRADSAQAKEKWRNAAKLYNEAVKILPTNFNGGVGSDKQEQNVAELKASWWAQHAYCTYKMGQLELAAAEFQWVADNSMYARPADVQWARKAVTAIQQELYERAMEKKKQDALKLHNSDFRPH